MFFLYKVMVNWVDNSSPSFLIPFFHEWKKEDNIVHYAKLPVIKVSEEVFNLFLHKNDLLITNAFMNNLISFSDATSNSNSEHIFIIISPSFDVLTIKCLDRTVHSKSRLSPLHEQLIYKSSEDDKNDHLIDIIEGLESVQRISEQHGYYIGLTRTEKEKKYFIFNYLDSLDFNANKDKLFFILSELNNISFSKAKKMKIDKVMSEIKSLLKDGWTNEHEKIYNYLQVWK